MVEVGVRIRVRKGLGKILSKLYVYIYTNSYRVVGLYYGGLYAAMGSGDVHICQHYDDKCTENCTSVKVCDPPAEGKRSHCYTLWTNISGVVTIVKQSCWLDHFQCYQSQCEAKSPSHHLFCCCEGDMCNVNFSYAAVVKPPTTALSK